MAKPKDTSKAGRKALPTERKKKNYTVTLTPGDADKLIARFGGLTLAIRSHLISDTKDKQAINLLRQLKTAIDTALDGIDQPS